MHKSLKYKLGLSIVALAFFSGCKDPEPVSNRSLASQSGGVSISLAQMQILMNQKSPLAFDVDNSPPPQAATLTPDSVRKLINIPLGLFYFRAILGSEVCIKNKLATLTAVAEGPNKAVLASSPTGIDISECAGSLPQGAKIKSGKLKLIAELVCSQSISQNDLKNLSLGLASDKMLCHAGGGTVNEYSGLRINSQILYTLALPGKEGNFEDINYEVTTSFQPASGSDRSCLFERSAGSSTWTLDGCQQTEFQSAAPAGTTTKQGSFAKLTADKLTIDIGTSSGFYSGGSGRLSIGDYSEGRVTFTAANAPPSWELKKANGEKAAGIFGQ